jgi:hypothetical protein
MMDTKGDGKIVVEEVINFLLKFANKRGILARSLIVPNDSVVTAYLRLEIEIFNSKLPPFFLIFATHGEDDKIIDEFG